MRNYYWAKKRRIERQIKRGMGYGMSKEAFAIDAGPRGRTWRITNYSDEDIERLKTMEEGSLNEKTGIITFHKWVFLTSLQKKAPTAKFELRGRNWIVYQYTDEDIARLKTVGDGGIFLEGILSFPNWVYLPELQEMAPTAYFELAHV